MKNYNIYLTIFLLLTGGANAQEPATPSAPQGFLESIHHHSILSTTVPENGDQNPYAVIVAPVSAGSITKNDVLVDNFNAANNFQGTGTTIVDYHPDTKKLTTFAQIPKDVKGCRGGVGLTTAMTMLQSGVVIVGSTPSTDGTTATKGAGCLMVLDAKGKLLSTIAGAKINGPWGNMAVVDRGTSATLFVSMTGFGVGAPIEHAPLVNKATVLRIELATPQGKAPVVKSQTVIADGLSEQADKEVFIIGPTGLALGSDGSTLYVSDALNNRIVAIDDATTRKDSAGVGREVTKDGMLQRPLAMVMAPNGHLLVTNGKNGQVVEIDPVAGKQIYAQWVDNNKAQTPPGSGDLFGLALTPDGKGFYYVEDENNTLLVAQ